MRIGIVPLLQPDSGGVYQYSLSILQAFQSPEIVRLGNEVVVFVHDVHNSELKHHCAPNWRIFPLNPPTFRSRVGDGIKRIKGDKYLGKLIKNALLIINQRARASERSPDTDRVNIKPELGIWFRKCGVDIMFFPVPMSISFESGVPYVMAVHDLQHRLQPHFPEVSANGEWQRREYLFRNGIRNATLILVDSETGKEDVLNCYGSFGIEHQRIKELPFLPSPYLLEDDSPKERHRVRNEYGLPPRYFFYPAQFWPHKNHARIVEALGILKEHHGLTVPIVFCGSHTNTIRSQTFDEVLALSDRLGIKDHIHYIGYVPNQDMQSLYADAVALVMPTFFGPTNIPIIEAWTAGCPVLTSDLRGIREQVGNAAILVDPNSAESIADGLLRLWRNKELGSQLRLSGRLRLSNYTADDFNARLGNILEAASVFRGHQKK